MHFDPSSLAESSVQLLAELLSRKLQLEKRQEQDVPPPPKVLDDLSLGGIAKLIEKIKSSEELESVW